MPRRSYKKVTLLNDPIHDSYEITKLVNYLMEDGKKTAAQKIVYKTLENLTTAETQGIDTLRAAIANASPTLEVRTRKLGGASYQVPQEVRQSRKLLLALNWIIQGATARSSKEYKTFAAKLTAEVKDTAAGIGNAIAKKQTIEKQAEQNKAFAHLKW